MKIYELQSLSRDGSTSKLAPDWLHKSEIRSQDSKLTQLLTMNTTHKFPLQESMGPLLESLIVIHWLEAIHPKLPGHVRDYYGHLFTRGGNL